MRWNRTGTAAASALAAVIALAPAAQAQDALASEYPWPACGRVDTYPGEHWPPADPSEGWDPELLTEAEAYFDRAGSAAMMVVWRGHVIAAWGDVSEPYLVQSVRKPVINAIAGQLVEEGKLDMSSRLADLGLQDHHPRLTATSQQASVADVFRSRSGIYHSAHYEVGGWKRTRQALAELAQARFGEPVFPPGEVWVYNNWDFNAAGEIVTRAAGKPLETLMQERLVEPLGLQDFVSRKHVSWVRDGDITARMLDNRSAIPAYLFEMSARDLARVGLVNLGCGQWKDQRLFSQEWVMASTTGTPTTQGAPEGIEIPNRGSYGYLWFVEAGDNRSKWVLNHLPPFYYHSGNRGHRLYVMPHLDLVLSHTVATKGGIGLLGQMRRRIFGSPTVHQGTLEKLVSMVVAAHPDPDARAAANKSLAEIRAHQAAQAEGD